MNKEKYIVYKHTNKTSGKAYIGITRQGLMKRFAEHCKDSKAKHKKNGKFQNAIMKYGDRDWIHEILFISFDYKYLGIAEPLLILDHNTRVNGYNISPGGVYHNHHNGNRDYTSMRGENNPSKRLSTRKKISKALTGNSHSSFNGYWKTPWGYFCSMRDVSNNCPYNDYTMSDNVIYIYCKQNEKQLSSGTECQIPLFNKDDIGKTFKDLGFGYIPAERHQTLESALEAFGL